MVDEDYVFATGGKVFAVFAPIFFRRAILRWSKLKRMHNLFDSAQSDN